MWYPFFMVGGVAFWTLTFLWFVFLILCVEEETGTGAFISIVLYLVLINVFGNADVLSYLTANWYSFLWWVVVYIAVGVGWSGCKLWFSAREIGRKARNIRLKYSSEGEEKIGRELYNQLSTKEFKRMKFEGCTSDILFWMTYWPPSLFWTILNDPIMKFFRWVYKNVLQGVFKKIHNHAIGNVEGK